MSGTLEGGLGAGGQDRDWSHLAVCVGGTSYRGNQSEAAGDGVRGEWGGQGGGGRGEVSEEVRGEGR